MASTRDYFKLHFIVFLWGFSAILGKLVSIPAVEMVFFRSILAALGMAAVIYFSKGIFYVDRKDLIKLILIGFIVSMHWLAFFGSARVSNVSVSLVGFATNSLWAALLEPLFNKTKLKKYEVVLGLVVLAGLYVIFSFDFQYKLGLLLGILAGFTVALFSVFNSRMVKRVQATTITFYEMIGVCIGTAIFLPFYQTGYALLY
jgi:drug/metabolite transporter (DMT)-like permease